MNLNALQEMSKPPLRGMLRVFKRDIGTAGVASLYVTMIEPRQPMRNAWNTTHSLVARVATIDEDVGASHEAG
jgi:hypothetical protein